MVNVKGIYANKENNLNIMNEPVSDVIVANW